MSNDGNPNVFDGGVESRRHAETGNKPVSQPGEETSASATSFVRASGPEDKTLKPRAGVASGPSDPAHEPEAVGKCIVERLEQLAEHGTSTMMEAQEIASDALALFRATHPVSLNREAIIQAANIARGHAHHALWYGLLPYGWNETTEVFGRGLADRIADAILALIEGSK